MDQNGAADVLNELRQYLCDKVIDGREYTRIAVLVPTLERAADEIERLRQELETSRALCEEIRRSETGLRLQRGALLALLAALKELIAGVVLEVNEKGSGGFLLARLTDARAAIKLTEGK